RREFPYHEITNPFKGDRVGSYTWTPPVVSAPQTNCKVKVLLKDSSDKTVGSDISDGYFTIIPPPPL
ncbi:MAG: hypothetical protein ACUVTG_12315, partial [Candidatus Oleimicrobiaceae bacterium]